MNNSLYFAQYLLNTGLVKTEEIQGLLAKSLEAKPSLALMALREGMVTGQQLASLDVAADFAGQALGKNLLTAEQIETLNQVVPSDSMRFAQVMLDEGRVDFLRLEELFKSGDAVPDIIRASVRQLAGASLKTEAEAYGDFAEIFMRSFIRFMDMPAVIDNREPILGDSNQSHIVSQRLIGDISMTTGIVTSDPMFIEMARRYSHEDIKEIDELAADSLTEFLNVVNGLFAVDMARQDRDVDLEAPKIEANLLPVGNHQLLLRVYTACGSFVLVIASDEFVLKEKA
ncbi:MAG: hypothetical protein IJS96_06820 [Schwartzia sp.]|nr:hypothetical protein [Schwartzia sp. (in: firmicutes)]